MPTITLTPHIEAYLREALESGRYSSVEDVIHDALRLHEQRKEAVAATTAILRAETQKGLDDVTAGRLHTVSSAGELLSLTEFEQ